MNCDTGYEAFSEEAEMDWLRRPRSLNLEEEKEK